MKELNSNELSNTYGGSSITGTLVDAIVGGIKFIYDVGKDLGFALRRFTEGNICPI